MEFISAAIDGIADVGKYLRKVFLVIKHNNLYVVGMLLGPCLGYIMQTLTMV